MTETMNRAFRAMTNHLIATMPHLTNRQIADRIERSLDIKVDARIVGGVRKTNHFCNCRAA